MENNNRPLIIKVGVVWKVSGVFRIPNIKVVENGNDKASMPIANWLSNVLL